MPLTASRFPANPSLTDNTKESDTEIPGEARTGNPKVTNTQDRHIPGEVALTGYHYERNSIILGEAAPIGNMSVAVTEFPFELSLTDKNQKNTGIPAKTAPEIIK